MKAVRLSALRIGRLYSPGNIPGTHFCQRLSQPQGHSAAGRIMSMKKIQWHHRESKPRPSDLWRSASTNCATSCPGLHVKQPLFLSDLKKIEFFGKYSNSFFMKIRLVGGKLFHTDGRTDRRKDMTKLIVVFRKFANAPKKYKKVCQTHYITLHMYMRTDTNFFLRRWRLFQKSAVYNRGRPKLFNIL